MRKLGLVLIGVVIVVAVVTVAGLATVRFALTPALQGDIITTLAQRYGRDAELDALHWRLLPGIAVRGEGVRVGGGGGDDSPPLISVGAFEVDAGAAGLFADPRRINSVRLEGLDIRIPAGRKPADAPGGPLDPEPAPEPATPEADTPEPAAPEPAAPEPAAPEPADSPVLVNEILADAAHLEIASNRPGKSPRIFEIYDLRVTGVSTDSPLAFDAVVINPTPPGRVATTGTFGPWNKAAPRYSAIEGEYTFTGADLGVFRGIGGVLDATGTFSGTLDDIVARGRAQITDFVVTHANQPVDMIATFETRISDKASDIDLVPVDVSFGSSSVVAVGEVSRRPGTSGRTVALDVTSESSRIEDMLKFALTDPEPPLTGDLDFHAVLEIPPGPEPVIEKLRLEGEFSIREAVFTKSNIQGTLARVSRITGGAEDGLPEDEPAEEGPAEDGLQPDSGTSVVSDLQGEFSLAGGVLSFSRLSFSVPGTRVELVGSMGLVDETLDLRGLVLSDRAPSEMATGTVARILQFIDPVVAGEAGGATVPIVISGHRSDPKIRVDTAGLLQGLGDWGSILERFGRSR